jgi:YafQ family addiction module toxin component
MREFEISPELRKILVKLSKKDKSAYEAAMKKIEEVAASAEVEHYKNLRYDFKELKRVHVGHFVLVFNYDKSKDFIYFVDFNHHDVAYKH